MTGFLIFNCMFSQISLELLWSAIEHASWNCDKWQYYYYYYYYSIIIIIIVMLVIIIIIILSNSLLKSLLSVSVSWYESWFFFFLHYLLLINLILQLNGVDLTSVTAEQAMLELCKPTETVQILAQFNPTSEFSICQSSLCGRHRKGRGSFLAFCPLFMHAMYGFGESWFPLLLTCLLTVKFCNSLVQGQPPSPSLWNNYQN